MPRVAARLPALLLRGHPADRCRRTTATSTPIPASKSNDEMLINPKVANTSPPMTTASATRRLGPGPDARSSHRNGRPGFGRLFRSSGWTCTLVSWLCIST